MLKCIMQRLNKRVLSIYILGVEKVFIVHERILSTCIKMYCEGIKYIY